MLWVQRRNRGAHGAENSIQISALAGVGPWHLAAADVATRLPSTPPFSRLLRDAGGYSRTILTPNLQGYTCVHVGLSIVDIVHQTMKCKLFEISLKRIYKSLHLK